MIRIFPILPFLLSSFLWGQGTIPNVRLKMLDGNYAKLYDFLKDGPMIIDFWATWCEPCKKQMNYLNNFHNHFSESGFKVLAINTDTPKSMSQVKSFDKSKKFAFMVAVDPNSQVMKKMGVKLMPTTILLDKNGSIIYRHQGYLPGDEVNILKHITDHFDSAGIPYAEYDLGQTKDTKKKEKIEVDF